VCGRGEIRTGFWYGKLKRRNHLEDLDTDGEDNYKVALKEIVEWINLVESRNAWRADVKATLNVWVL
jgi:hypothetical protein